MFTFKKRCIHKAAIKSFQSTSSSEKIFTPRMKVINVDFSHLSIYARKLFYNSKKKINSIL